MSETTAPAKRVRPRNGDELDLHVESLAHGGAGVARLEGYVVFVLGAVPGDRVRARVHKSKRGYAEARAIEVLEPSPERIEPIVRAEQEWHYRNKLEYSFGEDEAGELVLGFHHPGRWDLVDDVASD